MIAADDPGFSLVARHLEALGGPSLADYKGRCLRRRLAVRMRACGMATLTDYAALLESSPEESTRLVDALTINVTEFFRNPEVWERLEPLLLALVARQNGAVRLWSAGCSAGHEPYSLALLIHDLAARAGVSAPPRHSIDATDLDPVCIERARVARYPASTVRVAHLSARHLIREGEQVVVPAWARDLVRVARHDLLRDPAPAPPYDLIVCRNVIIYFERLAQDRLLQAFLDALSPRGLLVLGRVESVLGPLRGRLELLHPRERIYRKVG